MKRLSGRINKVSGIPSKTNRGCYLSGEKEEFLLNKKLFLINNVTKRANASNAGERSFCFCIQFPGK